MVELKGGEVFYRIFKVCGLLMCSKDDLQVVVLWP